MPPHLTPQGSADPQDARTGEVLWLDGVEGFDPHTAQHGDDADTVGCAEGEVFYVWVCGVFHLVMSDVSPVSRRWLR